MAGILESASLQSSQSQLLEQANSNYRALRSAEAVRLYREYLAQYADRADVRTYLGGALLNLHQLRGALEEARSTHSHRVGIRTTDEADLRAPG